MQHYLDIVNDLFIKYNVEIKIIGGIITFLLLFILRNQLAKAILNIISFIFFKNDEKKKESLIKSLKLPFSVFFAVLGAFIGVYVNIRHNSVIKCFKIAVILIICWALINYLTENLSLILNFGDKNSKVSVTAVRFISNLLKIILIAFAIVMIISELGYNINGLIAGIGVGGLAISLATQDLVSNLISGFIIVLEKPFEEGDFITTKSISGTVIDVTMRSTKIRTLEDSVVTIPNKSIADDAIINFSRMNKRLIDIEFGLVYSTPNELLEKCRSDIKDYLTNNETIIPAPLRIEIDRFEESALTLNVFCYTTVTDIHEYKGLVSEVNLAIKEIIEKNGAEFAFPSTSVYIEKK